MTDNAIGDNADDHPDLAHLPAKDRAAMRRLRDWLSLDDRGEKRWVATRNPHGPLPWPEIVCLLAGIDPEASFDPDVTGLVFFPGVLESLGFAARPREEQDWHALGQMVAQEIERMSGLHADAMTPVQAVRLAVRKGATPPWLDAALDDPFCRQFLPRELLKEPPKRSKASEAGRKKRMDQLADDDKQGYIEGIGRETFEELRQRNFPDCRKKSGAIHLEKIADQMLTAIRRRAPDYPKDWPVPKTLIRRIKKWMPEETDTAPALSDTAPAKVAN